MLDKSANVELYKCLRLTLTLFEEGKEVFLLDEKRAKTFLYPYGYKASRKDGIRPTADNLSHEGKKKP